MYEIDFPANPDMIHESDAVTEGDWVVFRCPICKDYERRINTVTDEMKVKNVSPTVCHSGCHIHSNVSAFKALSN
jgi:hypothetical protein